jgi:hypothetical protein
MQIGHTNQKLEEMLMFKRKPLWLATATALGVASLGSFLANPAFAQDQDQDADEELLVRGCCNWFAHQAHQPDAIPGNHHFYR